MKRVFVILMMVFAIACNQENKVDKKANRYQEVFGKYETEHEEGYEYILLKNDTTYVHYFKNKEGKEFTNTSIYKVFYFDTYNEYSVELQHWEGFTHLGNWSELSPQDSKNTMIFMYKPGKLYKAVDSDDPKITYIRKQNN